MEGGTSLGTGSIMMTVPFHMEDICKDSVTGFSGQVTAMVLYHHGSNMIQIENEVSSRWMEVDRCELIRCPHGAPMEAHGPKS